MNAMEKSDLPKVAEKRANKAATAVAEFVKPRGRAKENAELQSTVRTQSRAAVSQAQGCIREAVIRNRQDKLTALLYQMFCGRPVRPAGAGGVALRLGTLSASPF
jgi:RNA-directed DNA polymerase